MLAEEVYSRSEEPALALVPKESEPCPDCITPHLRVCCSYTHNLAHCVIEGLKHVGSSRGL